MTEDEKRKAAKKVLKKRGYTDSEIKKILRYAWGEKKK